MSAKEAAGKEDAVSRTITTPTDAFSTDIAKAVTHIQPVLILSVFYARFEATVADPLSSLTQLLLPLCLLQAVYCVSCLPPAGTDIAVSGPSAAKKRGLSKSASGSQLVTRVSSSLLSLVLSALLGTPIFSALVMLHGAPLTTHHFHTLLLALHLSLLALPPLFYTHGVSDAKWRDLISLSAPLDEILMGAVGTVLGSWLGAIPIPLDWDREWQKWPVTVVAGSYGGLLVGRMLGKYLLRGSIVRWTDDDALVASNREQDDAATATPKPPRKEGKTVKFK